LRIDNPQDIILTPLKSSENLALGHKKSGLKAIRFFCSSENGSYFEHFFAFLKISEGLIEPQNDLKLDISAPTKNRLYNRRKSYFGHPKCGLKAK